MNELDAKLRAVAADGDLEAVKALVTRGANLNARCEGDDGETIFTHAVSFNHDRDYLYELLQLGAKADVPDCDGATPLSLAVLTNDFLLAKMLLTAGANPNALSYKSEDAETALDIAYGDYCVQTTKAEELNLDAIVELLKQHGGKTLRELKGAP